MIKFNNVNFSYKKNEVLKDFNLYVNKGDKKYYNKQKIQSEARNKGNSPYLSIDIKYDIFLDKPKIIRSVACLFCRTNMCH